jgi:hypothetical protein
LNTVDLDRLKSCTLQISELITLLNSLEANRGDSLEWSLFLLLMLKSKNNIRKHHATSFPEWMDEERDHFPEERDGTSFPERTKFC